MLCFLYFTGVTRLCSTTTYENIYYEHIRYNIDIYLNNKCGYESPNNI